MENYFRCYAMMLLTNLTFKGLAKVVKEFESLKENSSKNVYDDLVNSLKELYEQGQDVDEVVNEMILYFNEDR